MMALGFFTLVIAPGARTWITLPFLSTSRQTGDPKPINIFMILTGSWSDGFACSAPLNTQLQIKLRNRDKQQSNAGSQNRQAGPRSQGRNVAARKTSVLRGFISAFVDSSGARENAELEGGSGVSGCNHPPIQNACS
jgi:hypothetical protein